MTTPIIGTFNDVRGVEKAKAALREAGLNIKQFDALSGGEDVARRIVDLGFSQGVAEDVGRVAREAEAGDELLPAVGAAVVVGVLETPEAGRRGGVEGAAVP